MEVKLLHHTPLTVAVGAIRECWGTQDKSDSVNRSCPECGSTHLIHGNYSYCKNCGGNLKPLHILGNKDVALVDRVANKFKHESTIEHISYNFEIDGISRALLQELARHRMSSFSVKSTRYTLAKDLKNELPFVVDGEICEDAFVRADRYVVLVKDTWVDTCIVNALENLRSLVQSGKSNDLIKYAIPEAYKTSLHWTINARSLKNFLTLRTNKSALWEIRELAQAIYEAIPNDHKFLFTDCIQGEGK